MKNFLENTEESGRFIVYSPKTGITYYIEPLDEGSKVRWGDLDPGTKTLTGDYGSKYKGSIKASESLITEENGFKNIQVLEAGVSPYAEIERIDEIRYAEGYRPKNQNLPR